MSETQTSEKTYWLNPQSDPLCHPLPHSFTHNRTVNFGQVNFSFLSFHGQIYPQYLWNWNPLANVSCWALASWQAWNLNLGLKAGPDPDPAHFSGWARLVATCGVDTVLWTLWTLPTGQYRPHQGHGCSWPVAARVAAPYMCCIMHLPVTSDL